MGSIYEEADGQLIVPEVLDLELGAPPAERLAELDARRQRREADREAEGRLATAIAYSAYGRGLEFPLEVEERRARRARW
jgi:hypothetical protein